MSVPLKLLIEKHAGGVLGKLQYNYTADIYIVWGDIFVRSSHNHF